MHRKPLIINRIGIFLLLNSKKRYRALIFSFFLSMFVNGFFSYSHIPGSETSSLTNILFMKIYEKEIMSAMQNCCNVYKE